jgi:hypothetical protein
LKLSYDKLLSTVAVKINLRRYTLGSVLARLLQSTKVSSTPAPPRLPTLE